MVKDQIKQVIKGKILDDSESLKKYSRDASIFEIQPQLITIPKDIDDIKALVKFVSGNKNPKLSLTCRAAGTDMTGGAINDSIIIDLKNINNFIEQGSDYAITQPGIMYKDFEIETLKKGLILPTYPASREICTVGGMVATNAGGELNLTYGQLSKYVLNLKVILSDGNEYLIEPLNFDQLNKKIAQQDFEGKLYLQIFNLIKENQKLIQVAKPVVSKNSTGYPIWDIWDGEVFDLTKIFIGSQGTLGIITEIKLELISHKSHQVLLAITLPNLKQLDQIINRVLSFRPESFECFDKETLELATKFSFELAKDFKHSTRFTAFLRFIPEIWMYLTKTLPELVMIANFTADTKQEALSVALNAEKSLQSYDIKVKVLDNISSAEKYWIIRHKSFGLLRLHSENGQASSFIDDFIVKPEYLPQFLPQFNELIKPYKNKMVYTLAGHIGDGNFHIIPLMDLSDPVVKKIIPELMDRVFDLVFKYKGSMSAEHNDGLVRGPYLEKMYGEKVVGIFKKIKNIFDPEDIFNPHKKTDATMDYSFSHLLA